MRIYETKIAVHFFTILAIVAFSSIAFFVEREQFYLLLSIYILSFLSYLVLARKNLTFRVILRLAILFRLIFLFSTPTLSDDFYRFVWDGKLVSNGISPYSFVPNSAGPEITDVIDPNGDLLSNMNSPNYYSVYPTLHQAVFVIAASLGRTVWQSVVIMRLLLIAFEIILIILLVKILGACNLPIGRVAWYALNPLVIIEVTGNLHFEALMMTFLLAGLLFLFQRKQIAGGISIAASILTKLTSAMFLPLLVSTFGIKRNHLLIISSLTLISLSAYFSFSGLNFSNIGSSLKLYLVNFEFNASVYYVIRAIVEFFIGYNAIQVIGPIMAIISFVTILVISFYNNRADTQGLFKKMTWIFIVYLVMSTTIHPWYLIPTIVLMVPAGMSIPIVWSLVIVLSYSAYSSIPYSENLWLVGVEYLVVFFFILLELTKPKLVASFLFSTEDGSP